MNEDKPCLGYRNIPREIPSMHRARRKKRACISSDDLFFYDGAGRNCRQWSTVFTFVTVDVWHILVYRNIGQRTLVKPVYGAVGSNDTRLDFSLALMPGFPISACF